MERQRTLELSPADFQLPQHLRAILVGASASGKSSLILDWIRHKERIFPSPFYAHVIFCSPNFEPTLIGSKDQRYMKDLQEAVQPATLSCYDHLITPEELMSELAAHKPAFNEEDDSRTEAPPSILLCLDDFSLSVYQDPIVASLFTRLSSHANIGTIICVHQGLNCSGKNFAMVWQSANYLVLFRNNSDKLAMTYLSRKIFPYSGNYLGRCLDTATDLLGPYEPLCIDTSMANRLSHQFPVVINMLERQGLPCLHFKSPYNHERSSGKLNGFP